MQRLTPLKKLRPQANEPIAGLNKVATTVRDEKIGNLFIEAKHFEQLEQWQQAVTSYEKVLQLDGSNEDAQQAMLVNQQKTKILADLSDALAAAGQLHNAKVLKKAEQVLADIAQLAEPGTTIAQRGTQLETLVKIATTPIPIILESDNQTEVIVYKVARLGTFNRTELQLRPGPYTVVGTRNGYRDVRKTIELTPQSKHTVLSIFCEEPI